MFSAHQLLQAIREARNDKNWGNSLPARGNIIIMLAIYKRLVWTSAKGKRFRSSSYIDTKLNMLINKTTIIVFRPGGSTFLNSILITASLTVCSNWLARETFITKSQG